jgi:calcineurin-like phosphoesterase
MEFARGSIRKGVKPIANSGVEVLNTTGNELWAQREVVTGLFRANILIANELCPGCGLFHISAPHRSRVKGQQKPHQPARLSR